MDRPTAVFPLCSHIKKDGNQCGSAALKGLNFCFQHIGGTVSSLLRARATTSSPNAKLDLAYPDSREAIQHNLHLVAEALSDGKIDTALANTYIRLYRATELNLHRWEKAQKSKKEPSEESRMSSLPAETPESNPDDGPLKPAAGLSGEHNNQSDPDAPAAAPCLAETWEQCSDQEPNPSASAPMNPAPPDMDWKKYDHRFLELERLYIKAPDYGERVKALIQECIDAENAALATSNPAH